MALTVKTIDTKFPHEVIEPKWQNIWEENQIYEVKHEDPAEKWYELTMYPYPSGDLHVGHWFVLTGADIHARFKKMKGFNVLHPMGFDAFGLNAENAAIQRGIHPKLWTTQNMAKMRQQMKSLGPMYDWNKEVVTCDPGYYKWNQWFFIQFFKKGLAYRENAPVNWCPSCVTVLANEQVIDGTCERCETSVTHKDMNQWFFRITDYAEELLDQTKMDWPERINTMQTNWIGKSEGAEVEFDISEYGLEEDRLKTFTTRIDTLFGVSFVVLAPEHPMVPKLTTPKQKAYVDEYVEKARVASEVERLSTERPKTGVFLGTFCTNKVNGDRVPLLTADYVLHTYGTGIVMGVPAHDERDYTFAKKYGLPIKPVVLPADHDGSNLTEAYTGEGLQINSGSFDGMPNNEGKRGITEFITQNGWGRATVNYRMRDWLISRQRYWGTPIPVIYCTKCGTVPVPEEDLPVLLPDDAEFLPTGESPLALHEGFVNADCPSCGGPGQRETDTMDTFVDSSWYFLRYVSPKYPHAPFDPKEAKLWNPVHQYTGGVEHAVMHLLYARFFVKAARDIGLVDFHEPFQRLFNQGVIIYRGNKMSKSRGNVISPDEYVKAVGSDVVRTYLMFIGPWDQGGEWNDSGINGAARWLNRIWDLVNDGLSENTTMKESQKQEQDLDRILHQTIAKVTNDIENFKYNTAISSLMELTNCLYNLVVRNEGQWNIGVSREKWREVIQTLLVLASPIAPHITEELWQVMGNKFSIHQQDWPKSDDNVARDEVITLVVQVNGKVRDKMTTPSDIDEEGAKALALKSDRVISHIHGKKIVKVVLVPKRLINLVTQ